MTKDEMKNRISMALKDPVLQQGFEIICKENAELKESNKSYEEIIDNGSTALMKEKLKNYKLLAKAKEIIKKLYLHVFQGMGFMELNDYNFLKAEVEQFLKEVEE